MMSKSKGKGYGLAVAQCRLVKVELCRWGYSSKYATEEEGERELKKEKQQSELEQEPESLRPWRRNRESGNQ
jgi:hypothetical protein